MILISTARISKIVFCTVLSTIKLELATVQKSKTEYRTVISQNTSEIKLRKIREGLGLSRKAFSEYIGIPLRNLEGVERKAFDE